MSVSAVLSSDEAEILTKIKIKRGKNNLPLDKRKPMTFTMVTVITVKVFEV